MKMINRIMSVPIAVFLLMTKTKEIHLKHKSNFLNTILKITQIGLMWAFLQMKA